ncbi:hypothetical protein PSTG_11602 [Puccinia striiformis f. sp. tritici PST-78]|uniref:Uncharacterized protein n=1 Tax=Puccinia striiformis f. sp. tritici PST-78 TaxID=1165861 RepID=A0A0L0V737_9BASI|nr:hypothetical protein PSTG_11602 [Puccinia striiformis f. sp. tritici PST-78]
MEHQQRGGSWVVILNWSERGVGVLTGFDGLGVCGKTQAGSSWDQCKPGLVVTSNLTQVPIPYGARGLSRSSRSKLVEFLYFGYPVCSGRPCGAALRARTRRLVLGSPSPPKLENTRTGPSEHLVPPLKLLGEVRPCPRTARTNRNETASSLTSNRPWKV